MAVLYYQKSVDRDAVIAGFYPFTTPEKITGLVIGNDLDALLSASLLKTIYGWDIVGIYDYTTLWYSADIPDFSEKLIAGNFLAVDLDIYHPEIPSIGHHVLELTNHENLPGHRLALNPNLIRGISQQNFRHKYPLGMIHFLLWVFNIEFSELIAQMLFWLADSAYINAQAHRFRDNVSDWLINFMPMETLINTFSSLDSIAYEQELQNVLISQLKKIPICRPSGQVRSRHLRMTGYQCQWSDPVKYYSEICSVLELIIEITGWKPIKIPVNFEKIEGVRRRLPISDVFKKDATLAEFLKNQAVFSYVFLFSKVICVTNQVDLNLD